MILRINFSNKVYCRIFLLLSFLVLSMEGLASETETINLINGKYANETITWNATSCVVIQSKGNAASTVDNNFISVPHWRKGHNVAFSANDGYVLEGVDVTCVSKDYANALCTSTYSNNAKASRLNSNSVEVHISTKGDFTVNLAALCHVSSIKVTYSRTTAAVITTSTSTIDFGKVQNETTVSQIFTLSGSKLDSGILLNIVGDGASMFSVSRYSFTPIEDGVEATDVVVSYNPATIGTHSANINISTDGLVLKTIALKGESAVMHQVKWMLNGVERFEGSPSKEVLDGDRVTSLPSVPDKINDYIFMGWTNEEITGQQSSMPAILFTDATEAPVVDSDVTYHAVYCSTDGSMIWKKLLSSSIQKGTYMFITSTGVAFSGEIVSGRGQGSTQFFSFGSDKTSSVAPTDGCEIVVEELSTKGHFRFRNPKYGYLVAKAGTAGNLAWNSSDDNYWYFDEAKKNVRDAKYGAYLQFNGSQLNTYGSNYGSAIFLAKKELVASYFTTIENVPTYVAKPLNLVATNGEFYWTTLSNENVMFVPEDVTVYAVTVDGSAVTLSSVAFGDKQTELVDGNIISGYHVPANTGVLLKSPNKSFTYYEVSDYVVAPIAEDVNMLKPAPVGGGVFTPEDNYMYYKLAYDNYADKSNLGFYWGSDNGQSFKVKANTAYLAVPRDVAEQVKGFVIADENATNITELGSCMTDSARIYTLSGMRIAKMSKPGIYIVNGKKMIIKGIR